MRNKYNPSNPSVDKKNNSLFKGILTFTLLIAFSWQSMAQERTVTGNVKDASDELTIPGVNIIIQGTSNGTITDLDGNYQLVIPNDNAVLEYSFVGYEKQFITVGSRSVIDIALSTDIAQLNEVVVIGYGAVEKKDVTGSIVSISTKEFNKGLVTSPQGLLVGKVAGVQITSAGGEPGGGSVIRIRGASSLPGGAGSDPLIVIDGVPMSNSGVAGSRNPLNFVNPSDIESITVLKDASAAAIYGSRAANGVIIITTKSGEAGKITVNYDAFYSISTFVNDAGQLSPGLFRQAIDAKAPQEIINLGEANTKWVDEITRPATGLKQMLSVSGGTENHRFYTSINYLKNEGVLNTSLNESTNFSLKYNGKFFNDVLKVNINTKYGKIKNQFAPNTMGSAIRYDPTRPVFDSNNTLSGGYYQWPDNLATRNPVADIELADNSGETNRFLGNIEIELKIPFVEGLSIKTNLAKDVNKGESFNLTPMELTNIYLGQEADSGRYSYYTDERTSELFEIYSTYKKTFNSIEAKFDVTAGYSWQEFNLEGGGTQVIKLGSNFDKNNFLNGTTVDEKDSTLIPNRLISFFGRMNFHLKDRYLLTVNVRRDGSTRFGPTNRWGLFPSVALGWRVLDESFAEPLTNIFSDLKLRYGYGVIGNQEIGDFEYLPLYTISEDDARVQFGYDSDGNPVFVNLVRPEGFDIDLKWEETRTTNIGLDFGLIGGRIYGSIDIYQKKTVDLLSRVAFPAGSKTKDRLLTNIGEMENKGIELLLNSTIVDKTDFRLSTSFNIGINKNTIKKLDNSNDPNFPGYETGNISGIGQQIQILKVGESINSFRLYQHKYENGSPIFSSNPVDMYVDINEDGIINELDRVLSKSPDPKVILGLTTNMSYKSFDLAFTLRSNIGGYVYNDVSSNAGHFRLLSDRVTNNIHKSAFATNFGTPQVFSDYYLESGTFVKLDNITLSYNKKVKPFNLRVYTTIQNALTITGYSGIEPETNNGIDNNIYPRSFTALVGINIKY